MDTLNIDSIGPDVKLLQSLLSRIGYWASPVDGIYGDKTKQAVEQFQTNNNINSDGIVGPETWGALEKYINGYEVYTVQPTDTLNEIAKSHFTSVDSIVTANLGVNLNIIYIGQKIIVPFGIDIVFTDIDYTYEIMERNIKSLKVRYPFVEVGSIGQSVLGKNLYYIKLGHGKNQVFYNASHHAKEWITSVLLMKFTENFARAYSKGNKIMGYDLSEVWEQSSIYILPMVNPDGVDLVINGLSRDNPFYNKILELNKSGLPFWRIWQANIHGVDLNLNYPAHWELAKYHQAKMGITSAGPYGYVGPESLSEPETRAVVDFTNNHNFRLVLAYHSQGKEIYWNFRNIVVEKSLPLAKLFARASGYTLEYPPIEAQFAGFKDWFVEKFRRPGFTIEVGIGKNPLPITQFNTIYQDNEELLLLAAIV